MAARWLTCCWLNDAGCHHSLMNGTADGCPALLSMLPCLLTAPACLRSEPACPDIGSRTNLLSVAVQHRTLALEVTTGTALPSCSPEGLIVAPRAESTVHIPAPGVALPQEMRQILSCTPASVDLQARVESRQAA